MNAPVDPNDESPEDEKDDIVDGEATDDESEHDGGEEEWAEEPEDDFLYYPPWTGPKARPLPAGLLSKYPLLTFLLPFAVFMVVGSFEPTPPEDKQAQEEHADGHESTYLDFMEIDYKHYPVVYSVKIGLCVLSMLLVLPGYLTFPLRINPIAIVFGVVGGLLWVGICSLQLEHKLVDPLGLEKVVDLGKRSAFNPLKEIDNPAWAYGFLAIRLFGLVAVISVLEEFFLRGWILRWCVHDDWWEVRFGESNTLVWIVGTAVPLLMHPGEIFASLVWFTGMTWLMVSTRNIWDCVAAHAITNLVLGIFVITFDQWHLM